MLINLPSDFTDIRFSITTVEHSETYDTNFVVHTDIPYEILDTFSVGLIDEDFNIIQESLKLIQATEDTLGNITAVADVSSLINLPRGKYYLVPNIRGIFSANTYPVTLIAKDDADNIVDFSISGFEASEIAIYVNNIQKDI